MKWKEFKDAVEKQGVTDEMEIGWIDIHLPDTVDVKIEDVEIGTMTDAPTKEKQFTVA